MLRTFRIGGIHPPENKLSAGKKITALATPKQVIIPLSQHIGAPAQAVVKKGDLVVFTAGDPATNVVTGEGAVTNMMHVIEAK